MSFNGIADPSHGWHVNGLEAEAVGIRTDLISESEWEQLSQHLGLTGQQADIVRLLFWGRSDVEIAHALGIQPRTVRTQIDHIYQAFGLSTRLQLVLHVLASLRECWARADGAPF